ncbi:Response regulator receiver domain-containing protein [Sulfitobacter marinus]|uniref:Response regulator receiver domain-containing protein n=1 Tax=Sulfitobacter marinus TaxID=394264 RepID=A0A1I6RYF5_9RHOB|nr:response regulator [Sulfitobacter marinus]SFS69717.1 Response regulator receiver domain-containing protein [Sulfitobacter marinus]
MTDIPVVIVDDNVTDRYIVRRRLAKAGGFGQIFEADNGDDFLNRLKNGDFHNEPPDAPLLILMDVNMPRKTGFETIAELEELIDKGAQQPSMVVMMLTSSSNPRDMEQAEQLETINGYVFKPLDDEGVRKIHTLYR